MQEKKSHIQLYGMNKMKNSIKKKLLKQTQSIIILCSLSIGLWTYFNLKTAIEQTKVAELAIKSNIMAHHTDHFLSTQKLNIKFIASSPLIKNSLIAAKNEASFNQIALNDYFAETNKLDKSTIKEIFLITKEGKIIATTKQKKISAHQQQAFYYLKNKEKISVSDPFPSKRLDDYYLIFTHPIQEKGEFLGNLVTINRTDQLYDVMLDSKNQGKTEETYIINKNGVMISPSRFLQKVILKQKVITPNTRDFISTKTNYSDSIKRLNTKPFINYRNALVYGSHKKIEEANWLCIAEINKKEALKPLRKMAVNIIIIVIIFCVIGTISTSYIIAGFSKTINIFQEGITKMASGDLKHRINTNTDDELNILAQGFNNMAAKLQISNKNLKNSYNNLEAKIDEKTKESENAKKAALSLMQDANMEKENTKMTLRKLQYTNEKLRNLSQAIEQSPISVVIADDDAKIIYINPKFTEVTGFEEKEIIGKDLKFITTQKQSDDFYQKIWEQISSGNEWKGAFENQKKNGETYWEQSLISPVFDDERKITHYLLVKEDKTLQKKYEEALKQAKTEADNANKAKSAFLRNINHEIRTPINAIIGISHIVLKSNLPKKEHEYIEKIQSSAESLAEIVNDILDYSKFESDKMQINITKFKLNNILENIQNIVSIKIKEKQIDFKYTIKKNTPNELYGDPVQITQLLLNIVNNAIKFTHKGHVKINVESKTTEDNKILLQFAVQDTGIGLSEQEIQNLFVAFTQADTSTTREYEGTGLGLYISKKLIEMMNGKIWVKSKKDQGSTFFFNIEVEKADAK